MTNDKFEFKKEALLYAQYSVVVDKMKAIFDAEMPRFFDAMHERMEANLPSGRLRQEASGTYRSWWIVDNRTKNNRNVPYAWVRFVPQTVFPGVLNLTAQPMKRVTEAQRQEFENLRSKLRLPKSCTITDGKNFAGSAFFGVDISYGEDDPVAAAAGPVLRTLIALHDVERRLLSNAGTRRRSG
jgi:hypothetical protein